MAAKTAPRTWTIVDGGIEIEGTWYRAARFEGVLKVLEPCSKCGGTGEIPHYYHVHDGVCFDCKGGKGTWNTPAKLEQLLRNRRRAAERRLAKAEQKRQASLDERERVWAAFRAANPDLAFMASTDVFDEGVEMHHIHRDMGAKLARFGSLSDKQIDFARRIVTEQAQRDAERASSKPAPTGRVVVEGRVIKAVETESHFGYSTQYQTRITVKTADGWVANGNAPHALLVAVREATDQGYTLSPEEYMKGARVRFTATLETKEEGGTFAFFKRPAKPEVLPQED